MHATHGGQSLHHRCHCQPRLDLCVQGGHAVYRHSDYRSPADDLHAGFCAVAAAIDALWLRLPEINNSSMFGVIGPVWIHAHDLACHPTGPLL
ncbi:hypothetical protein DESC_610127 [Desulfosarcina cetonica]|nr:hypothetical protein DESC_610127 [Desulfosarcina cetonica]